MKYKADLERILTTTLRKSEPSLSEVRISDDGVLAVIQVADKYMPRRLSALGKRFLRSGSEMVLAEGESFLEPEWWSLVGTVEHDWRLFVLTERELHADFFFGKNGITVPHSSGGIHFVAFFLKLQGTKNSIIFAINYPTYKNGCEMRKIQF